MREARRDYLTHPKLLLQPLGGVVAEAVAQAQGAGGAVVAHEGLAGQDHLGGVLVHGGGHLLGLGDGVGLGEGLRLRGERRPRQEREEAQGLQPAHAATQFPDGRAHGWSFSEAGGGAVLVLRANA